MALTMYLDDLKRVKQQTPRTLEKPRQWINRVEVALGKSVLQSSRGEIIDAVIKIAETRKVKYNGGHQDNGKQFKYRVGIVIKQFLEWATAEKIVTVNVFPSNPFPKPPIREAKYLTDEQLNILLTNDNLTVKEHALVRFMLDTGMRKQELMKCKRKAVNFKERLVHIPDGKNSKFRTVPFSEKTLYWMRMYLDMRKPSSEFLFCTEQGEPMSTGTFSNRFKSISNKIGFRLSAHMLRHTCGTLWAKAGIDHLIIMRQLGHVQTHVTAQYVHAQAKTLRDLQGKVNNGVPALKNGRKDLFLEGKSILK